MGLIDIVRKAQSLGPADPHVASFPLQPSWLSHQPLKSEESTLPDDLVCWLPVPPNDESVLLRIQEEERLIEDLNQRLDGRDLPLVSVLDQLLRSYLEKVAAASEKSFCKLLRKAAPRLGQKLLSTVVKTCVVTKNWEALQALLDSHAVSGYTYPDLVSKLVEGRHPLHLCLWIKDVRDPRPSDSLLVLKFFLNSLKPTGKRFEAIRKEWRHLALTAIDKVAGMGKEGDENVTGNHASEAGRRKMKENKEWKEEITAKAILLAAAVDGFLPCELCLHCLVAKDQDEAVLASILSQLDTSEILVLLRYLDKWLNKYSRQSILCTVSWRARFLWVPTLAQILQWISVILDEHYTTLILCSDFHSKLRSMQLLVKGLVDVGYKLAPLVGIIEHIRANGLLPVQGSLTGDADHVIEYLEI